MKRKQKKIVMIVLGLAAVALCAVQLGPILLGGNLADTGKSKKKPAEGQAASGSVAKKPAGRPASPPPRAAPKGREAARPEPESSTAGTLLENVIIDLSAIGRRVLNYPHSGLRNPFAPALFEVKKNENSLASMKLKLQGIVVAGGRRLAIIENRVYAEGDEVAAGITLRAVEADCVSLTDGKNEVRLAITAPTLRLGKH